MRDDACGRTGPDDVQQCGLTEVLLSALADRAEAEDREAAPISGSVDRLRSAGILLDDGSEAPREMAQRLMRIAGVNLSLARLYEGHVNALRLIGTHGAETQIKNVRHLVRKGAFLGVWGADGDPPLTMQDDMFAGSKRYASGLGTVTHALVSLGPFDATRLALVAVGDPSRQDKSGWRMPGMRATASGAFDFSGLRAGDAEWIGGPGDFGREPTFVGGVWRIAAIQTGAAIGLIDRAASRLKQAGRLDAEAQTVRMATRFMQALAARETVLRAAEFAEGPEGRRSPEHAVCLSAAARLLTEDLGLATIATVEQCLGLPHFDASSVTARMTRDLAVYMRQAARDAFLLRVGQKAFATASVWDAMP